MPIVATKHKNNHSYYTRSAPYSLQDRAGNKHGSEEPQRLSSGSRTVKRAHGIPFGDPAPKCSKFDVTELRTYQCKSIASEEVATNIRLKQELLVEGAFNFLDTLNIDSRYHIRKERNDRVRPFVEKFQQFYKDVILEDGHIDAETLSKKQQALYAEIHQSSALNDAEKIGLEYAIGLVRLLKAYEVNLDYAEQLATQLGGDAFKNIDFVKAKQTIDSKKNFFNRINAASKALLPIINEITKVYTENAHQNYWQSVRNYFENNPHQEQLASVLVSMQFIPEELDFLGIAQFIHWNGVGGVATYPSQQSLDQLKKHAFAFHGFKHGNNRFAHFSDRMKIFGLANAKLKEHVNKVLINALCDADRKTPVKIYDACSGPKYSAVSPVAEKLAKQGKKVSLTVSDVDGSNLHALFREKVAGDHAYRIDDVRYEDLNGTLDIEPEKLSSFDLVSAAIGLHQLPPERQKIALQYFTRLAKTGGYVSIPHVNEYVNLQLMLIPVNIIDREGFVDDKLLFNFKELAVPSSKEGYVKVPYPIRQACLPEPGKPKLDLYDYTVYKVIEIPKEDLESLQSYYQNAQYNMAEKLILQSTGLNLNKLAGRLLA